LHGNANCGDDSYATGIWGAYGSMVDAIGLICAVYHPPAAAPPADKPVKTIGKPKSTKPPPEKPSGAPLKIDNGAGDDGSEADNGGGGNGGGRRATAAADTTIYDAPEGNEIGYLSAGDALSGLDCNDNNWCRITKPQKGWVWGEDIK